LVYESLLLLKVVECAAMLEVFHGGRDQSAAVSLVVFIYGSVSNEGN
jgi:hypothetical protein